MLKSAIAITTNHEAAVRAILTGIILCLTLSACGTKGPLYLPEKQYPQDQQSDPKKDIYE
jgi:predicted small lipoprotein YifL